MRPAIPAAMVRARNGRRASRGRVSAWRSANQAEVRIENTTKAPKMPRQPVSQMIPAPMSGATAGISVLWTLGFMGWLGIPVNIMTSIVPALVIIIGSTEDIHLLAEYAAGIRAGLDRRAAIGRMADNMGVAVLLTFITTYLGFLSIALNDIQLLFQFGVVSSTGLLFNFVITVLLVPVMLRFIGHRKVTSARQGVAQVWFQGMAVGLLRAAQRRRLAVLGGAGILVIAALAAATQLRINNNLLDYLDPASQLRADVERIHTELSGVHAFSIVVDSGIDNTFMQVKYLEEVLKIQDFMAGMDAFDRTFSFANFVAMVNSVMAEEGEEQDELWLPDTDDQVREYMLFIRHSTVAPFVSKHFDRARILVRHNTSSSDELNRAIDQVREFVDGNIDPGETCDPPGSSAGGNGNACRRSEERFSRNAETDLESRMPSSA